MNTIQIRFDDGNIDTACVFDYIDHIDHCKVKNLNHHLVCRCDISTIKIPSYIKRDGDFSVLQHDYFTEDTEHSPFYNDNIIYDLNTEIASDFGALIPYAYKNGASYSKFYRYYCYGTYIECYKHVEIIKNINRDIHTPIISSANTLVFFIFKNIEQLPILKLVADNMECYDADILRAKRRLKGY